MGARAGILVTSLLAAAACGGPTAPGAGPPPIAASAPADAPATAMPAPRPAIDVAPYPAAPEPRVRKAPPDVTGDGPAARPAPAPDPEALERAGAALDRARGDDRMAAHLDLADAWVAMAAAQSDDGDRTRLELRALAHYKQAADPEFENVAGYDRALFQLADALQRSGDAAAARKLFHRLIKTFPASDHVPAAFLSFGDYFFERGQMENAGRFYDKVLQFPDADVAVYARYKRGWVHMNLDDQAHALEAFTRVVDRTRASTTPGDAALHRAAARDAVLAYAGIGKPGRADDFFRRLDRDRVDRLLDRLARVYVDQGRFEHAATVLGDLIAMARASHDACRWHVELAGARLAAGDRPRIVAALERLTRFSAELARRDHVAAEDRARCDADTRQLLGETARTWHIERHGPGSDQHIAALYRLYIERFPASPEVDAQRYYLADLLWRSARGEGDARAAEAAWRDASVLFQEVAASGRVPATMREDAADAASEARQRAEQLRSRRVRPD